MPNISELKNSLAIAMWDFSWLYRHYPYGEFENWPRVLDGLAERGYNAVRIDAFPHLIATDPDGNRDEVFRVRPGRFGFSYWGTPWTIDVKPRESLLSFLQHCKDREILVALSTWMGATEPQRNSRIEGAAGLARVWNETLTLIAEHDLLDQVVFVDLLNEYPDWHGLAWLHHSLKTLSEPRQPLLDIPGQLYNDRQKRFYRAVMDEAIAMLREQWPAMPFTASNTDWRLEADSDYSLHGVHDNHFWLVLNREFSLDSGYWQHIHNSFDDTRFAATAEVMLQRWREREAHWEGWLDEQMHGMAELAARWNVPFGNTEGWASIFWLQHPQLSWNWVKEVGEVCARLGAKHGMAFNCTSNFTHPHFPGLWDDVEYHQRVTAIIRAGKPGVPCTNPMRSSL